MSTDIKNALDFILEELAAQEVPKQIKERSKKRGVKKRKLDLSHFNLFLKDFDITPGTTAKIEPRIIAYLYFRKWKRIKEEDKSGWYVLFREVGNILERNRWGRRRFFLAEKELDATIKEEAKAYFKEIRQYQKINRRRNVKKVPIYW